MTLEYELKRLIPDKYDELEKFENPDPYHFDSWAPDRSGESCMYYWFWNKSKTRRNKKRVVPSEVQNLLENCQDKKYIKRGDFKKYCPNSETAGPCGFVVTTRMLEYLGIVKYRGRTLGMEIVDTNKLQQLI